MAHKLILGVTIALLALTGVITYAVTKDTTPTPTITYTAPRTATEQPKSKPEPPTVKELLKLVNAERKKVGVAPLVIDERLNKSAQIKSDELEREGWDDTPHVNDDGKHGYTYVYDTMPSCPVASENLHDSGGYDFTAKSTVESLKTSKAHYKAMVNARYDVTGFGISKNYVVQHFCDLP